LRLPLFTRQSASYLARDALAVSPSPHFCFFIWPKIANGKTRCVGPRNGAAHLKGWQAAA
jgi:hypothetical protein